ncbi:MAG: ATP-dependent RNA helicase HrpA [Desulfamplus sp.]|nr:ATP-dependent RNA helicase HrpA [Desulfamplus sp.]
MNKIIKYRKNIKIPTINYIPELPITDKKDEIIEAIKNNRVVIIAGETGSGKTTQIPKFCIAAGRGIKKKIGCTQPRRIAAINVAARIAEELGQSFQNRGIAENSINSNRDNLNIVGYKIRFDDTSDPNTIIKVMTDGILLAETQRDPFLNEYDTIIVDEAHERSLNIDFTLGILRTLIKKRNDLKVIITSATIDTEKFSKAFNDAPIIEVSGRMYPVEVRYLPPQSYDTEQNQDNLLLSEGFVSKNQQNQNRYDIDQDEQSYVDAAVDAVEAINRESRHGDILIFMPTEQDITETIELLRGRNWVGVTVLPLYARLSALEQAKIFQRGPGRKIIVSTNVAETSLTIPGVKYVVDTGVARIPHYSPRTRTTALPVTQISKSSADQRKGRCGRVENGICIRLYDEENYNSRALFTSPEILRSNLAEVILRMISLNLGDVSSFPFIDMPSPKSIKDGFDTLIELGAITSQKISHTNIQKEDNREKRENKKSARGYVLTEKGKIMAQIPVDPKLSRILLEANDRGCLEEAAIIASALSISDPRQRPQDKAQQADQKHAMFKDPASDFISLINIWNSCYGDKESLKSRNSVRKFCKEHYLSFRRMREWSDIHNQIMSVLNEHGIKGKRKLESLSNVTNLNSNNKKDLKGSKLLNLETTKGVKLNGLEIGGEFYTALHKSILSGYLSNIANKKEKNLYHAAKGQKAMIFPGSSIFNKAGTWIVASEYVETSQLFARSAATINVDWLEELGKDLCSYSWSSPHWEKKRGEVVAKEQVSLFGLIIVPERTVAYGKINSSEAGEIFIRHALVQGEIDMKFPFMQHNQKLIEELEKLEEKTRKRDILITDEDIYLFYRSRLDRDFYNIKTFAKYLKDRNIKNKSDNNDKITIKHQDKLDDSFLKMTLEDLQQKEVDKEHLSGFPDKIRIGNLDFHLEYNFNPNSETDGVTVKVPVFSAGHLLSFGNSKANINATSSIDWLVSGLFREKIMALIKNLPKSHRVKLLPASEKADIISNEIQNRGKSLFYELSYFVKERFNADIPPSAWSDQGIEAHLKMRISIRDEDDKEIAASRDLKTLQDYLESSNYEIQNSLYDKSLEKVKKRWEIENITSWDFLDRLNIKSLPYSIKLDSDSSINRVSFELFPALIPQNLQKSNNSQYAEVAVRLFKTEYEAEAAHKEGIRALFYICYENDMNALKKDIKGAARLKGYSTFFGGIDLLNQALYDCITNHLFCYEIRTKEDFETHASLAIPKLYQTGQELISRVTEICEEYRTTEAILQNITLKNMNRTTLFNLMKTLQQNLEELVPPNFLKIYPYSKIPELKRYISAIRIRAERAVVDLVRDQKRWSEVLKYVEFFKSYKLSCTKDKGDTIDKDGRYNKRFDRLQTINKLESEWSKEKAYAIDNLFWMIEEYKVSLFAQELKTAIKVSAARLDAICKEIDRMI